jgi:aspartyl-tRNA(Asn)/glutamyl-tRNA(Gln) amidotransferase subunit B
VRAAGEDGYRTRWELKNMNSFNFLGRGIDAAVREQIALYEAGQDVVQETYDYDAGSDTLTPHRSKEEADDYRYFPEPDLVPIRPGELLAEGRELPDAPAVRIRRLEPAVGFATSWELVTTERDAEHDKLVAAGVEARAAANVVRNEAAGIKIAEPAELAMVIEARERLPREAYLAAVEASANAGFKADTYLGQEFVSDAGSLEPVIESVLAAHADQVAAYRAGKEGLLGFFVGQVMKETGGAANPKLVGDMLRDRLNA